MVKLREFRHQIVPQTSFAEALALAAKEGLATFQGLEQIKAERAKQAAFEAAEREKAERLAYEFDKRYGLDSRKVALDERTQDDNSKLGWARHEQTGQIHKDNHGLAKDTLTFNIGKHGDEIGLRKEEFAEIKANNAIRNAIAREGLGLQRYGLDLENTRYYAGLLGGKGGGGQLSEVELKTYIALESMKNANITLDNFVPDKHTQSFLEKVLLYGGDIGEWIINNGVSGDRQTYILSGATWTGELLRLQSGAAISDTEWRVMRERYLPVHGDLPEKIAYKKRNREVMQDAMQRVAQGFRLSGEQNKLLGMMPKDVQDRWLVAQKEGMVARAQGGAPAQQGTPRVQQGYQSNQGIVRNPSTLSKMYGD